MVSRPLSTTTPSSVNSQDASSTPGYNDDEWGELERLSHPPMAAGNPTPPSSTSPPLHTDPDRSPPPSDSPASELTSRLTGQSPASHSSHRHLSRPRKPDLISALREARGKARIQSPLVDALQVRRSETPISEPLSPHSEVLANLLGAERPSSVAHVSEAVDELEEESFPMNSRTGSDPIQSDTDTVPQRPGYMNQQ